MLYCIQLLCGLSDQGKKAWHADPIYVTTIRTGNFQYVTYPVNWSSPRLTKLHRTLTKIKHLGWAYSLQTMNEKRKWFWTGTETAWRQRHFFSECIYRRLIRIAPQRLRAFHKFKSHTSWIQYKTCTFYKCQTYKHNLKVSPFGVGLVKNGK